MGDVEKRDAHLEQPKGGREENDYRKEERH